jgi:hypothetical protein
MKKFAVVLLIAVFVALAASSCNKKTCPAYKNQFAYAGRMA